MAGFGRFRGRSLARNTHSSSSVGRAEEFRLSHQIGRQQGRTCSVGASRHRRGIRSSSLARSTTRTLHKHTYDVPEEGTCEHIMSKNALSQFITRVTSQSKAIPGSTQVSNHAGGFVFPVDEWTRLRRFLILGVDGPTYYASESELVKESAQAVLNCIARDGKRTVDVIVEISVAGRNPKQHAVIFALAACTAADDADTRSYALSVLDQVCRTGTHLFLFAGYVEQFRGWGRGLRRAVGNWYVDRDADALALQLVKYQQREGWSHRDLLRLSKPQPTVGSATDLALRWAVGKGDVESIANGPSLISAFEAAKVAESPAASVALINEHRLPWETISSEHLRTPEVWAALVPSIGLGALTRNLGRMTANGTFDLPGVLDSVLARLANGEAICAARLHPISVLSALLTYRNGRGVKGKLSWAPIPALVDALDGAFYAAFGAVEGAGKRTMLALDVSGSMDGGVVAGVPGLTPRLASAAMAAVSLATEPHLNTVAFTCTGDSQWKSPNDDPNSARYRSGITPLALSHRQRLDDIVKTVSGLPFYGTDCSLPMLYAIDRQLTVDHFVIYTDSETWAGQIHPSQALRRYREISGIAAKLSVVAMTSTGFSLADPNDAGMLDVVGFDTAAPQLLADFAAGRL
jgi:60 kDa SS-A/Ro ribonucleoprotein